MVSGALYLIIKSALLSHRGHEVCRCLAIAPCPDHTDSFCICVNAVACNHLTLSLVKAGRHTSMETLSNSISRPKTDGVFPPQTSDITDTNAGLSKAIPLPQHHGSTHSNYQRNNLTQELGKLHEVQPVNSSTAPRVLLEMD